MLRNARSGSCLEVAKLVLSLALAAASLAACGAARNTARRDRFGDSCAQKTPMKPVVEQPGALCGDGVRSTGPVEWCATNCGAGCAANDCPRAPTCEFREEACDGDDIPAGVCVEAGYGGGEAECTNGCTLNLSTCEMCVPGPHLRCGRLPFQLSQSVWLQTRSGLLLAGIDKRKQLVAGYVKADLTFQKLTPPLTKSGVESVVRYGDRLAWVTNHMEIVAMDVDTRSIQHFRPTPEQQTRQTGLGRGAMLAAEHQGSALAVWLLHPSPVTFPVMIAWEEDGTPLRVDRPRTFQRGASAGVVLPITARHTSSGRRHNFFPGDRLIVHNVSKPSHYQLRPVGRGGDERPPRGFERPLRVLPTSDGTLSFSQGAVHLKDHQLSYRWVGNNGDEAQEDLQLIPRTRMPAVRGLGAKAAAWARSTHAFGGLVGVHERFGALELYWTDADRNVRASDGG